MFSPQDLAALVAIAETGSVHGAAAMAGRTQPAISQAIRRLEKAVGFALLDRSGYRARLTERGDQFVRQARRSVSQAHKLRDFARLLERGVEPRLRIACHGAIPAEAWLELVEDLPSRFPDTLLEIQSGEGNSPERQLLSGEAQLAVVVHAHPGRIGVNIDNCQLGQIKFVTAVSAEKLAQLMDEDASLPQILVADFDDPISAYGVVESEHTCRVSNHRIKAAMIARGQGWGSIPVDLVRPELEQGTVRAIAHKGLGESSKRPISLCRRRDHAGGPVASHIWNKAQTIAI